MRQVGIGGWRLALDWRFASLPALETLPASSPSGSDFQLSPRPLISFKMHPSRNLFWGNDMGESEGFCVSLKRKRVTLTPPPPHCFLYRAESCSPAWSDLLRLLPQSECHIQRRSTVSDYTPRKSKHQPTSCVARPSTTVLDITIENGRIPLTGDPSLSLSPSPSPTPAPAPHRNSSEELSRSKTSTEEKSRKFPKFKLSLTAPPPKPKAKQRVKVPPPVVSNSLFLSLSLSPTLSLFGGGLVAANRTYKD